MTKRCPKCGVTSDDFARNRTTRDGFQVYCKECERKRRVAERESLRQKRRERHERNPEERRDNYVRKYKDNSEKIRQYLLSHPCVDCKESDPVVLDFDHLNQEDKRFSVSCMKTGSWGAIEREIAKCVVRCANCHRRRTAIQFGWGKYVKVQT